MKVFTQNAYMQKFKKIGKKIFKERLIGIFKKLVKKIGIGM